MRQSSTGSNGKRCNGMNLIDMFAASDYNDSTLRDRPPALFISDQIITDFRTRRDAHALVNDRASNPAMPPNVDIIKQNGFADVGIAVDSNPWSDHATLC